MTEWKKDDVISALRYGYWYNTLNSVAFRRLDFIANFTQLMLGSAVIASASGQVPGLSVLFGFCVTALTITAALGNFGARKECFKVAAAAYNNALIELEELSEADAKKRLARLQSEFDRGFECVDNVAHNRVCEMHEVPELKVQLKGFEKWRAMVLFGNH